MPPTAAASEAGLDNVIPLRPRTVIHPSFVRWLGPLDGDLVRELFPELARHADVVELPSQALDVGTTTE